MELAYRLATEESPLIQKIRDNVLVAIMPVADPDGRDRSIDWYNRYNINVTDYDQMSGVPYWGKYTKHDDNRDINYAGLANQNFLKWYLDWHPPLFTTCMSRFRSCMPIPGRRRRIRSRSHRLCRAAPCSPTGTWPRWPSTVCPASGSRLRRCVVAGVCRHHGDQPQRSYALL